MNILKIYCEYIKENKLYSLISLIFSLRLELFSTIATFFILFFSMEGYLEETGFGKIGLMVIYFVTNSILPYILSKKNLKPMDPYIQTNTSEDKIQYCRKLILILNFIFFSLTVSILISILKEHAGILKVFDNIRAIIYFVRNW